MKKVILTKAAMLIEGIGDEVVIFGSLVVGIVLIVIAWLSTYVSEHQVNVILMDRQTFHTLVQRFLNHIPGNNRQPAVDNAERATNEGNDDAVDAASESTNSLTLTDDDGPIAATTPEIIEEPDEMNEYSMLEEMFELEAEDPPANILPVQIIGMSEMEHFLQNSESQGISLQTTEDSSPVETVSESDNTSGNASTNNEDKTTTSNAISSSSSSSGIANSSSTSDTTTSTTNSNILTASSVSNTAGCSNNKNKEDSKQELQSTSEALSPTQSPLQQSMADIRRKRLEHFNKTEKSSNDETQVSLNTTKDDKKIVDTKSISTTSASKETKATSSSNPTTTTTQPSESSSRPQTSPTSVPPLSQPVIMEEGEDLEAIVGDIPEGSIRIRIKYLDDRQKWVHANPQDTIGDFKRTHFAEELTSQQVRFIFNGQELLRDTSTLASYNITDDNTTIHCLLSRLPSSQSEGLGTQQNRHRAGQQEDFLDLGQWMMPLCGLLLVLGWYCRIQYRAHFSATATITLIALTFLFIIILLAASWHFGSHGNRGQDNSLVNDDGLNSVSMLHQREDERQGIRTRIHRVRMQP